MIAAIPVSKEVMRPPLPLEDPELAMLLLVLVAAGATLLEEGVRLDDEREEEDR